MRLITTLDNTTKGRMAMKLRFLMLMMSLAAALMVPSYGAAQGAGVCAQVKIEIQQELAFERVAFEGRLRVSNDSDVDLTNINVELFIYDKNGDEPTSPAFFIQNPVVTGSMAGQPDGSGLIPAGGSAYVTWLFIPAVYAGGEDPRGEEYFIGGGLYAKANGADVNYPLYPDRVVVRPQPKLDIDYFLPRDVMSDDPFTLDQIEEQIPFDLGVRIKNAGFGPANNMKLTSGQPKIVENNKGLLIAFRLLQAFTHADLIPNPSLSMNFGTINPQSAKVGRWEMVSTLMGEFIEFDATYTHAPELGGELTSLIVDLDANWLTHRMLIKEPGFDNVYDFLADTTKEDDDLMPETIFSSEGQDFPVNTVQGTVAGVPTNQNPKVMLTMTSPPSGWVYTRLQDPSQGLLNLVSVRRSDGKNILVPENAWVTKKIIRLVGQPTRTEHTLHLVDLNSTGRYELTFSTPPPDENPPTTRPIVQEPFYGQDPTFYGTEETEVFLLAQDDISGVANTLWSVDGSPYLPAYPLRLNDEGPHSFEYYSVDRVGNAEPAKTFTLVVDMTAPEIEQLVVPPVFNPVLNTAGEDAVLAVTAQATDNLTPVVDLTLEIVKGTIAEKQTATPVHTATIRQPSGVPHIFLWNGRIAGGALAEPGTYTAILRAADPLDHEVAEVAQFQILEPYTSSPLVAATGEQLYPHVRGNIAVWQDSRAGNWDIYMYDFGASAGGALVTGATSQERPRVSAGRVVYQDNTTGNFDIRMKTIGIGGTTSIFAGPGNQIRPDIDGDYIVWQGNDAGNDDIYLYRISTGSVTQLTTNTQVQANPRISGNAVVYEDFSTGLADVYVFDIANGQHTRLTDSLVQQEEPDVQDGRIVWTDKRNDNKRDIYSREFPAGDDVNITEDAAEQAEPDAAQNLTVFTDYKPSISDPNMAVVFQDIPGIFAITSHPSQQRRPSADGWRAVWQDMRTGVNQIRSTDLGRPIADAGPDQVTSSGSNVGLDGSASFDPLAGEMSYAWTQVAGTPVTLAGANTVNPTFMMPEVTREQILVFALVVTSGQRTSAADTVVLTVRQQNQPPIADAGADQQVIARQVVRLDGTASSDPDGNALTPVWTALTPEPEIELDLTEPLRPLFTAPDVTTTTLVTFALTVSDGQYTSVADEVTVTINPRVNAKPVAVVASSTVLANERELVTLDAKQSFDPEKLPITFEWTQLSGPVVTLDLTNPKEPKFTAPEVTELTELILQLIVRDEEVASEPVTVTVEVRNVRQLPVANAGADITISEGEFVTLDGGASFHPDDLEFIYLWAQTEGPGIPLSDNSAEQPFFVAPVRKRNYTLRFRLTTIDDLQSSLPDTVVVNVTSTNRPPVANAGFDLFLKPHLGANVMLNGSASSDPDAGDTLTYRWTQIAGPAVVLDNSTIDKPKFATPELSIRTAFTFRLIVNDGGYDSTADTVTVTLEANTAGENFIIF